MLKASRLMPPAAASDAPPRPPPLRSIGLSAVREAPTAREIVAAASRAIRTVVGGGMDYARVSGAEAGGPGAGGLGPGDVEVTAIRAADEGAAEGGCGDAGSGGDGGGLASSRSDEPQAAARSSCDLGTPKMRRASTAGEMTLRDGDGLAFNQAGELVLLQSVAGDTSVGLAWTEAAAGLGLIPAARAVFHGGRFWMSEAPPLPERPEPTAEAASAADDDASPRPQAAPRHASSPTLSIRAACSPASSTLPMGSSFVIGGSTFRLERPLPEARSHELWGSLAVGLSLGLFGGGALHEFMMLPGWAWTNRGTIGRYNNKRATLPLRDLKIRRRHASFVLEGFKPLDKSLPSGGLWLQPWKGKPCLLLLGRQNHQL